MKRPSIPKETEIAVLTKSRRRCALCFHLKFSLKVKDGQIAHIDRDPTNNEEANLAFLCLKHHDEYDSRKSQAKGFQPGELLKAKDALEQHIQNSASSLAAEPFSEIHVPKKVTRVSVDIYNLRLPIYQAFHRLFIHVNREARVSDEEIGRFIEDTHNALFLFGEDIAAYAREVYHKAISMRQAQRSMEHPERYNEARWTQIVDAEGACMIWFSDQQQGIRNRFYQYLKI